MRIEKKLKSIQEKKKRMIRVSMPRSIKNKDEVALLFTGTFEVKLRRQTSRHCYVLFSSAAEKEKNLRAVKGTLINGKRVVAQSADTTIQRRTKLPKKKIVIPEVKEDVKITKALFVSNIKCGTKAQELKAALPGSLSVVMLKPYTQTSRCALVKMGSIRVAGEYLTQVRKPPIVNGRKLVLKCDISKKHKKQKKPQKSLKIYDGDGKEEREPDDQEDNESSDNVDSEEEI